MSRVIHGDCLDVMRRLADEGVLVDSIVTDPPYHLTSIVKRFGTTSVDDQNDTGRRSKSGADGYARLAKGFMGKTWDGGDIAFRPETWALAADLLKPGAHLVAFGGSRTFHRVACAIEDAGFEIRDTIMWLYGSGFPKSLDVSKAIDKAAGAERDVVGPPPYTRGRASQSYSETRRVSHDYPPQPITAPATDAARQWAGFGTALKPAHEPIILARKPLVGTVAANVLAHGTGALNVDGCRVATSEPNPSIARRNGAINHLSGRPARETEAEGRMASRQSPESYRAARPGETLGRWPANLCHDGSDEVLEAFAAFGERPTRLGNKATRISGHRNVYSNGLAGVGGDIEYRDDTGTAARFFYSAKASKADRAGSKHPTVKPVSLMRWLCRLVTPPGGLILDPFAGSGTTLQAAAEEGFRAIGIEREAEYVADIERRMAKAADLFTDAAA